MGDAIPVRLGYLAPAHAKLAFNSFSLQSYNSFPLLIQANDKILGSGASMVNPEHPCHAVACLFHRLQHLFMLPFWVKFLGGQRRDFRLVAN